MADYPKSVEEIYSDYQQRKSGLLRALTEEVEDFYTQCDPEKENLCLYGERNGSWSVDLPAEEVPPELPEPCLGINFARDGMQRKDWLALVAVHSDAWLMSVAFFYGVRLDVHGRLKLFRLINEHPTLFEHVTNRAGPKRPSSGLPSKRKKPETSSSIPPPGGMPNSATVPTGRMLTEKDITPALKGKRAELFWPDDQTWYLCTITNVNHRTKQAKIVYPGGEEEDLDLDEITREGHMTLVDY